MRFLLFSLSILLSCCQSSAASHPGDVGPAPSDSAVSGKRAPCTFGADQTCNEDPSVSSLWGKCTNAGRCDCKPGFELSPSGFCRPNSSSPAAASAAPVASAGGGGGSGADTGPCGACGAGKECFQVGKELRCAVPLDMSALGDIARFSGRLVGVRRGAVYAGRTCTDMKCGPEKPCCNRCSEGFMGMTSSSGGVTLTRGGKPLRCRAGMDCEEAKLCELASGYYDLLGTMKGISAGMWELEIAALEKSVATAPKAP